MLLASAAATAQDAPPAGVSSASPGVGSSAASVSPNAPPNAPIVLSPGVPVEPKKKATVVEPRADTRAPHRAWFGWQTLAVDIAIVGTTAAILRTTEEENHLAVFAGGTLLFLSASPLLHLAHGSGKSLHSLLFRGASLGIGTAFGALIIAGFAGCTEATPCKLEIVDFAAMGAGIGAIFAAIYDSTAIAWKPAPGVHAFVSPHFARVRGGGIAGLTVAF